MTSTPRTGEDDPVPETLAVLVAWAPSVEVQRPLCRSQARSSRDTGRTPWAVVQSNDRATPRGPSPCERGRWHGRFVGFARYAESGSFNLITSCRCADRSQTPRSSSSSVSKIREIRCKVRTRCGARGKLGFSGSSTTIVPMMNFPPCLTDRLLQSRLVVEHHRAALQRLHAHAPMTLVGPVDRASDQRRRSPHHLGHDVSGLPAPARPV
jgi:hypothetical protein